MEDLSIKAIVMGVSLFVTMLTLSAIIIYFNTARVSANIVNKRVNIADSYDKIMNSDNFEDILDGVEVRSLIRKYANNKKVKINIVKIGEKDTTGEYQNINNSASWVKQSTGIVQDSKLDLINPIWTNNVEKVQKSEVITLNIKLNVNK